VAFFALIVPSCAGSHVLLRGDGANASKFVPEPKTR
jgi:hypothetical protein